MAIPLIAAAAAAKLAARRDVQKVVIAGVAYGAATTAAIVAAHKGEAKLDKQKREEKAAKDAANKVRWAKEEEERPDDYPKKAPVDPKDHERDVTPGPDYPKKK